MNDGNMVDDLNEAGILDGAAITTSLLLYFGGSVAAARFARWFKSQYHHPATEVELGHYFAATAMSMLLSAGMMPAMNINTVEGAAKKIEAMMKDKGLESSVDINEARLTGKFGDNEAVH